MCRVSDSGIDRVIDVLTSTDELSCELRQNTPFTCVLSQDERLQVLKNFNDYPWIAAQILRTERQRARLDTIADKSVGIPDQFDRANRHIRYIAEMVEPPQDKVNRVAGGGPVGHPQG